MKKIKSLLIAMVMGFVALVAVGGMAQATEATQPPVDGCYREVTPVEREFTHTTEVQQWRYQTRAPLYGSKEVKEILGWDFVDGGQVTVNGQTVAGHWVQSPGWHVIPDVIINIVWGVNGVPQQYLGTGTVNLSSYGGPNTVVQYDAHEVQTNEGFTAWGPWSDWSTTNPGGDTDLRNVETRHVPGQTFTDWFAEDPGAPWVPTGQERLGETVIEVLDPCVDTPDGEAHEAERCVDGSLVTRSWGHDWEWDAQAGAWVKNPWESSSTQAKACLPDTGVNRAVAWSSPFFAASAIFVGVGFMLWARERRQRREASGL